MNRRAATVLVIAVVVAGCGWGDRSDGEIVDDGGDFAEIPGLDSTRIDVPRPTGAASAACDDDPLPPATSESTAERVAALHDIGLFAGEGPVSLADLVAEIEVTITDFWGEEFAVDDPLRDLMVAEQDADRVLWIDLEADVAEENQVYVETLDELAAISIGAFEPVDVTETWASETGPIEVAFDLADGLHELTPTYLEDWIDPFILVPINDAIAGSGRRFELYKAFDQTAFIMALTAGERTALEARGWCFE